MSKIVHSLDSPVDLGDQVMHPIDFGKVTYEPGAPKNAPRWIWRCGWVECRELPFPQGVRGPFKTLRAAERDADQFMTLFYCDHTEMGAA